MLQDRQIKVCKDLYKPIAILITLLILTTTAQAQITLPELLRAYQVPYIFIPSPSQEPVIITRTGKITSTIKTTQTLQSTNPSNSNTLSTAETTTQITEKTAYILTPLPPPETITLEINPEKAPPLEYILKLLSDRLIYQWDSNILVIHQLWKLYNVETQEEETGTYHQLLQKALENLKKKNQPKDLKAYYTLLPMPEILALCELHKVQCTPITDDLVYIDDPQPISSYLTQTRPKIHIQAYILLLSDTAKSELNISLNLLLSQARTPQFFSTQIKDNTLTLNTQRGILNALELSLKALAEKNQASIIASPSLLLDDRQTASIRQGYEIPVITPSTQTTPATTTYRNAYLSLTVQPTLLPNGQLRINLTLTKDSPDFSLRVGENIPIQTNAIQTTITIPPDTPILLGGITEESNANARAHGFLFFQRKKQKETRQLYILLYARLIEKETDLIPEP
ncbi:MAG: hypothetical protein QXE80_09255 [Pyrobaculum sp.]